MSLLPFLLISWNNLLDLAELRLRDDDWPKFMQDLNLLIRVVTLAHCCTPSCTSMNCYLFYILKNTAIERLNILHFIDFQK